MAVADHSIDPKILESAQSEFMTNGLDVYKRQFLYWPGVTPYCR